MQFCDTSQAAELKVTVDGASVAWIAPDTGLLCLRSGQLLQVVLQQQVAGGGAQRVVVARAGAAPQPSCVCSLGGAGAAGVPALPLQQQPEPALVFLGSAAGDSLLVRAAPILPAGKRPADAAEAAELEAAPSKRMRLEGFDAAVAAPAADSAAAAAAAEQRQQQEDAAAAAAAASDTEDEEALIYGTALMPATTALCAAGAAAAPAAVQPPQYQLKVLDSLANIGPLRDFAVAEAAGGYRQ